MVSSGAISLSTTAGISNKVSGSPDRSPAQNNAITPTCNCRGAPEAVVCPKLFVPSVALGGVVNGGVLLALKTSKRPWSFTRSVTAQSFESTMSRLVTLGMFMVFRPRLPRC